MSNRSVFAKITDRLKNTDDVFADEFAKEFVSRVKVRTPVDTGRLQSGWDAHVTKDAITIENLTPYAGFVEDGTDRMSGAHMLKTTMSEVDEIAKDVVRKNK